MMWFVFFGGKKNSKVFLTGVEALKAQSTLEKVSPTPRPTLLQLLQSNVIRHCVCKDYNLNYGREPCFT